MEASASAPAPRRWPWAMLLVVLCCGGGTALLHALQDMALEVAQNMARYGDLAWQNPEGTWVSLTPQQASAQSWGAGRGFLVVEWETLVPGLQWAELPLKHAPNPIGFSAFLLRVDPAQHTLRLGSLKAFHRGSVEEIATENGMNIAINAGYFSEEGPVGLLKMKGKAQGTRNRWAAHLLLSPSDVRILNQKNVDTSSAYEAMQGFPAIMSGGRTYGYMRHGGRGFDVLKVERRSAICVGEDGWMFWLATDTVASGLSLNELASLLGGLGCRDAMGLDGGTSTGFYLSLPGRAEAISNLKPVPVVLGFHVP